MSDHPTIEAAPPSFLKSCAIMALCCVGAASSFIGLIALIKSL